MKPNPTLRRNHLIWSTKHMAWWRDNSAGYSNDLAGAGHYTAKEAKKIAADPACEAIAIPFTARTELAAAQIAILQTAITKLRRIVKVPTDLDVTAP